MKLETQIAAFLWKKHIHNTPDNTNGSIVYKEADVVMLLRMLGLPEPDFGSIAAFNQQQMHEAAQIEQITKVKPVTEDYDPSSIEAVNTAFGIPTDRMQFLINHMMQYVRKNIAASKGSVSTWNKVEYLTEICEPCQNANEIAMQAHTFAATLRQIDDIMNMEPLLDSLKKVMDAIDEITKPNTDNKN